MINNFSEIFKTLRKEKQLTQEQIAEILGVSPQAVSRWENSATFPDVTLLPQLRNILKQQSMNYLELKKYVKYRRVLECILVMMTERLS